MYSSIRSLTHSLIHPSRDDPPGQSTLSATQELLRFVESAGVELSDLDPVNDLHIQDIDVVEMRMRLKFIEDHVKSKFKCTQDPMFEERVSDNHDDDDGDYQ